MKLTREEKINKIYEVIAYKTLSFGCRLLDPNILFSASSKARKAYQYIISQRGAIMDAISDPE